MHRLGLVFKLIIFLFLLIFALKNTDVVTVNLPFGSILSVPLVIVMLAFFAGGALFGVLAVLSKVFKVKRELARLSKEVRAHNSKEAM